MNLVASLGLARHNRAAGGCKLAGFPIGQGMAAR